MVTAFTSIDETLERVDSMPFSFGRIMVKIEFVPRSPLADQSATFDGQHRFA